LSDWNDSPGTAAEASARRGSTRNRLTVTIEAGQESGCDVFGDGWQIVSQIRIGEDIFYKVGEAIPPGGGAKGRSGLGQQRSPGQSPGLKGQRLRRGARLRAEPMFARAVVGGEPGHQSCGSVNVGTPRGPARGPLVREHWRGRRWIA
jgi:hypothetical protein